jgi:bifunctional non-homologous end joining protein LigD
MSPLKEYVAKRRFARTPEPRGRVGRAPAKEKLFVVQKHRASALHYDFRLESAGVLRSWAVPKGPSLDPAVKRLAMQVEDHPLDYATFEGVIPEGEYGGGTVMVWDIGTWAPDEAGDPEPAFRKGRIRFTLRGKKLKGAWVLVRTRGRQWLLMKSRDRYASTGDVTTDKPRSVVSRRLLAGIARDNGGDVAKAATGDP